MEACRDSGSLVDPVVMSVCSCGAQVAKLYIGVQELVLCPSSLAVGM